MAFALAHGNAEIHQHRAGVRHHHIRRLDIAVHDAGRMHGTHRLNQLARQTFQIVAHITAIDTHILTQILAFDQLGHNKSQRVVKFHIHNAAHARMPHLLQRHRLPAQALACGQLVALLLRGIVVGEGIAQNLHRILMAAIVPHTPYRAHGTRTKPGNQRVAANQAACFQIQCA